MGDAMMRELKMLSMEFSYGEELLLCLCYDLVDLVLSSCNSVINALLLLGLVDCAFCLGG